MIKRVLVYAYGKINHDHTYRAATHFAVKHNCQLTGIFVTDDYSRFATIYGPSTVNMAHLYYTKQKEFETQAKEHFSEICKEIGSNSQWHSLSKVKAQNKPAMYTDVIFVSQPSAENHEVFDDLRFVDHLIIDTGIPVIVIPECWRQKTFASHPMLGWKESREAVSAVRQALPLMRRAKQLDIVTIVPSLDQDLDLVAGVEISAYLAAHDVECKFQAIEAATEDHNEAATIQRHAIMHQCDLIIIGGYGHSRLGEIILGGVTRDLLNSAKVPVLFAH